MKLIIDISDKDYEKLKDGHIPFSILDVMQNGTPIPENPLEVLKAFYPNIPISTEEDLPTKDLIIRISRSEVVRDETNN